MARSSCVIGWDSDPAVSGQQKLVAVTCRERMTYLETLVYKVVIGLPLEMSESLDIEDIITKVES